MKLQIDRQDSEIIADIINGKKEQYEVLIQKYNQRLYRVAKGILWDEDEAEDAMQEAYIKAYKQLGTFEQRSLFSTWITRIVINECLMIQKATMKRNTGRNESATSSKMADVENNNPEKTMINIELRQLLQKAISLLPDKYRLVFIMREVENMSVQEVTHILNITETNIKVRLSRAKEMLRSELMSHYPIRELLEFNRIRCDSLVVKVFSRI